MAWKDDEFIKESEGQGYGGPSMDEIATRIQNKIIRWGAVIYDKFYGSQKTVYGMKMFDLLGDCRPGDSGESPIDESGSRD